MNLRCLIPDCRKNREKFSVFRVPKQVEMREKWVKAILDVYPELEAKTNSKFFVICGKHFHSKDFYTFRHFDYVSAYIVDRSKNQKVSGLRKRLKIGAVPYFGDSNLDIDEKPINSCIKQEPEPEQPIPTLNDHALKITANKNHQFKPPKVKEVDPDERKWDGLFFVRRTMPEPVGVNKEPNMKTEQSCSSKKGGEAKLNTGNVNCSTSLDSVQVKEENQEPNVKQEQSCGISEEVEADLYTRHVVKLVNHNEKAIESVHIKEEPKEPSLSDTAAAKLYTGDVVNRNSTLIEPVHIKEEPMEEESLCGVSEAAEANLYPGYVDKHNTKSIESGHIDKEEPIVRRLSGVSEEAAKADLYAGHVVKHELVLGPELLQMPDTAFRIHEPAAGLIDKTESAIDEGPGETMRNNLSYDVNRWGQFAIKPCSVRLQRILVDQKPHIFQNNLETSSQNQSPVSNQHRNTDTQERNFIPKTSKIGTEQPTKTFDCEPCRKRFALRKYLLDHYRRVHKKVAHLPSSLPHQKSQSSKTTFSCEICKVTFTSITELILHIQDHTREKPYECDVCKKTFRSKSRLANHILRYTLNVHKVVQSQSRQKYQCDMCPKSFYWEKTLYMHRLIHTVNPYKCGICNEQFTTEKSFNYHIDEHMGHKLHACDVCGKRFTWKSNLITHIRIHSNEKPYRCDVCAMAFKDLSCFNRHKLIHTKEKPHSCEVCDKTFAHRSTLIVHKRIHTGERPYKCDICNKTLSCKTALAKHTRVHTGEKRYSCTICQKAFAERNKLVLHTRVHTGEKPLMCNICNKSFARTHSLTTHKCI